jgi:hypothetical protein
MANASILSGNFTVYFDGDASGDKQIVWTGSTANTATNTVNELYSALVDLFDTNDGTTGTYIESGFEIPIKAVTSTIYNIGILEGPITGGNPWFIDEESIKHLTGGSLDAVTWNRVTNAQVGVQRIPVTTNNITSSQIGSTITDNAGASGTLLNVGGTDYYYGLKYLTIRPDDNTSANSFLTGTTTSVTAGSNTDTVSGSVLNGNPFWANLKTIGSIESGTNLQVLQRVYDNFTSFKMDFIPPFWPSGHIDRLIRAQNFQGQTIGAQQVRVFARKENTLYDDFEITLAEGTNIAPLATAPDPNNPSPSLTSISGFSITFGATTADIDDDGNDENYSITIDCNGASIKDTYRYLQYITREGSTTALAGAEGQFYSGLQAIVYYTSIGSNVAVGDLVGDQSSPVGLQGFIASINTTDSYVTIHSAIGTDDITLGENIESVTKTTNNLISNIVSPSAIITPKKATPFGSFAGGRFFGARGVLLTNVAGDDATNFELIDDQGNTRTNPNKVLSVTGLLGNTEVRVYDNPSLFTGGGSSTESTTPAGYETVAATTETGDGAGNTTIYYNNTGVVNIVAAGGASFSGLGALFAGDKVRVVVRDNSENPTLQLFDEFTVGSGSTSTNIVTTETTTPSTFTGITSSTNSLTVTVEKVDATASFTVTNGTYDIFVYRTGSLPIITKAVVVSDSTGNVSIPVVQAGDRVYRNPN